MTRGERWILADGSVRGGRVPAQQVGAWRNGEVIARDRPVAEVVEALRPYFNGLLVVSGDALAAGVPP